MKQVQPTQRVLLFASTTALLVIACGLMQPASQPEKFNNVVVTLVAETLTALPTDTLVPTEIPSPTPADTATPIPPTLIPTLVLPTSTSTVSKTDFVCDIIEQKPLDDTKFRAGDKFDVRWTIVNTGTKKWEDETYLVYQDGPEMTAKNSIKLPRLKPKGQYDVVFDATAPSEAGMQVMVWAVVGPNTDGDPAYWMCYPYVRIIVK
jgi:hypothetical protein